MVLTDKVEVKKSTNLIEVGNKLAVLVGVNKYDDSSINQLSYSVKDTQDLYRILVDPAKGGYNTRSVKVLSDADAEKPSRNNILSKLTATSRIASSEDSILFYFSGHGHEIDGKPYLLSFDSYRNTIENTALPIELIRKTMENSLARVKIIIVDACHSGAVKGLKDSGIMTKSFFESFFPPPEGFVVLTSCKLGESSHEWDEKEHGVFSYYLLEGLSGNADRDGDKIITVTDAYRYSCENVKKWAFEKGLEQTPFLDARIAGDIPFVLVEVATEKEAPTDKSVIVGVILGTVSSTRNAIATAESMCGSLLQYVEASKISKDSSFSYLFPYGKMLTLGLNTVRTSFEYKKENWSKIDEIIQDFDEHYYHDSITYVLSRRINVGQLVKKCKENAFEIISFSPEKEKEVIIANTQAWLRTKTTFSNDKNSSEISISKGSDATLERNFFSILNPENIIEFIKNCLE